MKIIKIFWYLGLLGLSFVGLSFVSGTAVACFYYEVTLYTDWFLRPIYESRFLQGFVVSRISHVMDITQYLKDLSFLLRGFVTRDKGDDVMFFLLYPRAFLRPSILDLSTLNQMWFIFFLCAPTFLFFSMQFGFNIDKLYKILGIAIPRVAFPVRVSKHVMDITFEWQSLYTGAANMYRSYNYEMLAVELDELVYQYMIEYYLIGNTAPAVYTMSATNYLKIMQEYYWDEASEWADTEDVDEELLSIYWAKFNEDLLPEWFDFPRDYNTDSFNWYMDTWDELFAVKLSAFSLLDAHHLKEMDDEAVEAFLDKYDFYIKGEIPDHLFDRNIMDESWPYLAPGLRGDEDFARYDVSRDFSYFLSNFKHVPNYKRRKEDILYQKSVEYTKLLDEYRTWAGQEDRDVVIPPEAVAAMLEKFVPKLPPEEEMVVEIAQPHTHAELIKFYETPPLVTFENFRHKKNRFSLKKPTVRYIYVSGLLFFKFKKFKSFQLQYFFKLFRFLKKTSCGSRSAFFFCRLIRILHKFLKLFGPCGSVFHKTKIKRKTKMVQLKCLKTTLLELSLKLGLSTSMLSRRSLQTIAHQYYLTYSCFNAFKVNPGALALEFKLIDLAQLKKVPSDYANDLWSKDEFMAPTHPRYYETESGFTSKGYYPRKHQSAQQE
jgi:hypothetical protein